MLARVPALAARPVRGGLAAAIAALSGAGLRGEPLARAVQGCPALLLAPARALAARARFARRELRLSLDDLAATPSLLARPLAVVGGRAAVAAAAGVAAAGAGCGGAEEGAAPSPTALPLAALGAWSLPRFAGAVGRPVSEAADAVAAWAASRAGREWVARELPPAAAAGGGVGGRMSV
jgi:hypothetical protein